MICTVFMREPTSEEAIVLTGKEEILWFVSLLVCKVATWSCLVFLGTGRVLSVKRRIMSSCLWLSPDLDSGQPHSLVLSSTNGAGMYLRTSAIFSLISLSLTCLSEFNVSMEVLIKMTRLWYHEFGHCRLHQTSSIAASHTCHGGTV